MKTSLLFLAIIASLLLGKHTYAQRINTNYSDGATKLQGYFAKAKTNQNKAPGVVIIPQWMGLSDHEKKSADKLALLGYHALAADIYGEGVKPKDAKEAGEKSGYYKNNYKVYQSRIKAAIDELIKKGANPDKIAVIGYCFGGGGAIEAARADFPVKGVVSFHGSLGKDSSRVNDAIKTKVLVLHGADDPFISSDEIKNFQKEMRDGKADWQMIYYANAVHAFTQPEAGNDNSKGAAYNELAAKRSWEHLKLFLTEIFQ
ncbi:dienelactone hydrolase family protein [Daejeonella oryzae]|uniref:dienelactone hydrolase family protein n=1 Tax=Daejeonella oryzae TaxID=1122943 RepID=UPI0003F97C8D|nr:dienelactone hydrolase family protein [Daejeonella oryzae]